MSCSRRCSLDAVRPLHDRQKVTERVMKDVKATRDLREMWDAYAESRLPFGEALRRTLAPHVGLRDWSGTKVLDIGCGDGRVAEGFARSGALVMGLEVSLDRVATLARRLVSEFREPSFHLVAGDGCQLPFSDESFEVVILCDVLEHVKDPIQVLAEATRVLRPGGLIYTSVPNRLSMINIVSDPHYNVPAVGLMPRRLAAWYVTRLLHLSDCFTVERYFAWWEIVSLLQHTGLIWKELEGRYEGKIRSGERPKAPGRRWLVNILRVPGVRHFTLRWTRGRLFKYFASPAWEFLLFKRN